MIDSKKNVVAALLGAVQEEVITEYTIAHQSHLDLYNLELFYSPLFAVSLQIYEVFCAGKFLAITGRLYFPGSEVNVYAFSSAFRHARLKQMINNSAFFCFIIIGLSI